MNRRVVITGIGAVTPLGNSVPATWKAINKGRSGVAKITHFDASLFPSQIAGELKDFDFSPWIKKDPSLRYTMSNTRFAMAAMDEAIEDADLDMNEEDMRRVGIYFAAGDSGQEIEPLTRSFARASNGDGGFHPPAYLKEALRAFKPECDMEQEPFMTLKHLIRHYRVQGPVSNCLTACAASAQAIGEGRELIRRGSADVILSGGSHSMIHPFGVAGFCLLSTLSTSNDTPEKASRPFDGLRNGFVLSEGAGAVILEEYEHARKRGARIYGEIAGYGSTADSYRLTDSHPEGLGAGHAVRMALADAGLGTETIDYLNAHGTSTKVNDSVETSVIKQVFGSKAWRLPVSSTKSMTGHLIAASGAVELQFCLLAMRDGVVPPTINLENQDPECDLDYVPKHARNVDVKVAMSHSFGFGGQNIVLIVRKI